MDAAIKSIDDPGKASIRSVEGLCRPGYAAMKMALRTSVLDKGSDTTIRTSLQRLDKAGWIFSMKKTNARMVIQLRVPYRFRKQKVPLTTIAVLQ